MSTPQKVQFMQLPSLSLEKVLEYVDPIDVLNLSLCSKKTADTLKKYSKQNYADSCLVYIRPGVAIVTLMFETSKLDVQWRFENDVPAKGIRMKTVLSGVEFEIFKAGNHFTELRCANHELHRKLPIVIDFLQSLFSAPMQLVIEPNVENLQKLIENPCFSHCDELYISRGYQGSYVDLAEFDFIFRNISIKTKLSITTDAVPKEKIPQIYTVENLNLNNATWLNGEDLLKLNCHTANFRKHNFSENDIEKLVKKWQTQKETPILEDMVFYWNSDNDLNFKDVVSSRWDPKKRSKRCKKRKDLSFTYDCFDTMDVEREDGLLASIGIVNDESGTLLLFHVWHDRFPTKEIEEKLIARKKDMYAELPEINRKFGIHSEKEIRLTNPELTFGEFHDILTSSFADRNQETESLEKIEAWVNFHVRLLHVLREIDIYF